MASEAGQKPCLGPVKSRHPSPRWSAQTPAWPRGCRKFLQSTFATWTWWFAWARSARQGKAGQENVDRQTVCSCFWGVGAKQVKRFGLAVRVVLLSLSSVLWLFGGACKLAAMVEAKKQIVFTSGRLGTCFVKKIFCVHSKENGLAAGCL